jgi:hypothetical protein
LALSDMPVNSEPAQTPKMPTRKRRLNWRLLGAFVPVPLQIALVVFWLAWGISLARGPLTINIGGDDNLDMLYLTPGVDGFFQAESRLANPDFPEADNTYRWAGRTSRLKIPWPLDSIPLKAYVRLTAPRPDLDPEQTGVTLKARGKLEWIDQDLGRIEVDGSYQGNYYEFKLPEHLRPNLAAYELSFEADNAYQPGNGDVRGLAVLFFSLRLEPDYDAFGWKGWLASFARPGLLAVIAFSCWALGRYFLPANKKGLWALGFEASAGVLLLASLVFWRQAAEPIYASWTFILPLAWLLLALAEAFRRRAAHLPAAYVYAATLFPLLPLAQFAFGRLDLYSVNPGSVLIGGYVAALFYVGAIYINSGPKHPDIFERAFVRGTLAAATVSFVYDHFNVFKENLYRGADFKVYYSALTRFEAGGPLYDLKEIANLPGAAARMPPGFSLTVWPLAQVFGPDVNSALLTWRIFNELLLIPIIFILLKVFGGEREGIKFNPAVWFLGLSFGQIAESLGYGQWNVIVLLCLALMALWVKEGKLQQSGMALALPISLKLYPVMSALYFVLQRNWRAARDGLLGLIVGGLAILGLSGLITGFDQIWFYFTQVVFGVNRPEVDISNQSLWGFWSRLAVPRVMADFKNELPAWIAPLSYASVLALTLVTCLGIGRKQGDEDQEQLKLGALALLAVLIPPFVWFHYIVPCLVAVLALLVSLSRPGVQIRRWELAAFGIAYACLGYGSRTDFFFTDAVGLARLSSSYRFLAALCLWGLCLWLLRKPGPVAANQAAPEPQIPATSASRY